MQPSKIIIGAIVVLAAVISLSSLAVPFLSAPTFSTSTLVNSSTFTSTQTNVYTQTTATTILVPYSTSTSSYLTAYFLCDPAAMGCPGPPAFTTTTYSEAAPSFYPVVQTNQVSATLLTVSTTTSTLTSSQNVPAYSTVGLGGGEFAIVAGLIIAVLVAGLVLAIRRSSTKSESKQESIVDAQCVRCGAKLDVGAKFCGSCGAQQ